jgi:hypothetical protein
MHGHMHTCDRQCVCTRVSSSGLKDGDCCGQGQQGEAEAMALLLLNLVGYERVSNISCASAPVLVWAQKTSSPQLRSTHTTSVSSVSTALGTRRNALYGSDESHKKAFFEAGLPNVLRALLLRPGTMGVARVVSRGLVDSM